MNRLTQEALAHARAFLHAEISAVEFEARLVALGFYNVEFSPPAAALNGVRIPLDLKERMDV